MPISFETYWVAKWSTTQSLSSCPASTGTPAVKNFDQFDFSFQPSIEEVSCAKTTSNFLWCEDRLSRQHSFEFVLVVKTSEYRRCQNTMMSGNVMALDLRLDFRRHWLGYSWSEARMRTSSIVVTDPSLKNSPRFLRRTAVAGFSSRINSALVLGTIQGRHIAAVTIGSYSGLGVNARPSKTKP
jgi:hypothetical protein